MLQALQEMMSLIQAQTDQVAIAAEVEERMQTSVTQRKSRMKILVFKSTNLKPFTDYMALRLCLVS